MAWTKAKYKKLCRDANADTDDYSDEMWYDLAKCVLEHEEEGLEEFIREKLGAEDVIGRLSDDLAYPCNCK